MDKSDFRTMRQYAAKMGMMHKPISYVYHWYEVSNSLSEDTPSYNFTLWS